MARLRVITLLLPLGLLGPPDQVMAWPSNGTPVCVQPGYDVGPQVVTDGNGGAFIVWGDGRPSPTSLDFYIQRLTGSGDLAAGWPVNGVPVFLAEGDQSDSQYAGNIIPDGEGGCLLAWIDWRTAVQPGVPFSYDIYAQKVTPSGAPAPGWPIDGVPVATQPPAGRPEPTLASDGAGGAIIVWEDSRSGIREVYAQHLTASGTLAAGWPEHGLLISTVAGEQAGPRILADGAGGAIIVFTDGTIYGVRITGTGEVAPGWVPGGKPLVVAEGGRGSMTIVSDGAGGAYFCWVDGRTLPPGSSPSHYLDIYAQRITGDGEVAPGWPADGLPVCTEDDTQWDVKMMADGFGNAILVWEDYRGPVDSDAYAQKLTPGGTIAPGWTPGGTLVSTSSAYEFNPRLAPDGLGGAYFAYESWTGTSRAYAQHLTAEGVPALGWTAAGAALADTPGEHQDIEMTADGLGGAIVAWDDTRAPGGDYDIYAHRLAPDGPVAVQLSLVSVEAEPGRVRLVWTASDGAGLVATVERRTESDEWRDLGSITADGTGKLVYQDRAITPGARYAYRLAYPEGDGTAHTTETWVTVPAPRFALRGLTPNPSLGDPVVAFSLASNEPAAIELYDLAGRLVHTREVGSLGTGAQSLRLETGGRLAAGVYSVVLRQGTQVAITRAVVIR